MTYRTTRCVGMIAMSCNVRPFGGNAGGTAEEEDEGEVVAGSGARKAELAVPLEDAEAETLPSCVSGAGGALLRLQEVRYPPPRDMCVSERDGCEVDEETDE
jgi:hypothetical protein